MRGKLSVRQDRVEAHYVTVVQQSLQKVWKEKRRISSSLLAHSSMEARHVNGHLTMSFERRLVKDPTAKSIDRTLYFLCH